MNILSRIEKIAAETGFSEFGYVKVETLHFNQEIRTICEENTCRNYASSWACPPAVGTLDACRERVQQYDKMLLFSKAYQLEDAFDFEGMVSGLQDFKQVVDRFHQSLQTCLPAFLLLSNEGCKRCPVCTYPDAPCRFPQLLHHSLEGYGFIVSELAKEAGIRYHNGADTVTFFGALFFHSSDTGFSL